MLSKENKEVESNLSQAEEFIKDLWGERPLDLATWRQLMTLTRGFSLD